MGDVRQRAFDRLERRSGTRGTGRPPQWLWRLIPIVVLLAGLALTVGGAALLVLIAEDRRSGWEERLAASVVDDLEGRLAAHMEVVSGLRGYLTATGPGLERAEYERYLTASGATDRLAGVQAVSWAPVVPRGDEAAFEARVAAEELGPEVVGKVYPVTPGGDDGTSDRLVIDFPFPLEGNESAIGLDMATEPIRRATVERARRTGTIAVSAPIELAPLPGKPPGILLIAPVFVPGDAEVGAAPRPLAGVVVGVLVVETLLADSEVLGSIELVLSDLGPVAEGTGPEPTGGRDAIVIYRTGDLDPAEVGHVRSLEVGGRIWQVALAPQPRSMPSVVLFSALVVLALLATVVAAMRSRKVVARFWATSVSNERLQRELEVADERLSVQFARFEAAARAAKVGLWECDLATGSFWSSGQALDQLGLSPDDLTSWDDFVALLHPDDRTEYLRRPSPTPPGEMVELALRLRHRDGSYRRIRARSQTIWNGDRPVTKVGSHIDVTEDEIARLNETLAEANRKLEEFNRVASHDLRSPLRAISGYAGLLREGAFGGLSEEVDRYLGEIEVRAVRMGHLLDGLQAYSRAGNDDEPVELVDLHFLVAEVVGLVDDLGCELIDQVVAERPVPMAAVPFATTLRNLVDNACKHHHRPDGTVRVQVVVEDDWVLATVADDGPGIAERDQERIFQPYRQLKPVDDGAGGGVGLALVHRNVAANGGHITVDSQPGRGSTFTVRWPLARTEPVGGRIEASNPAT